MLHCKRTDLWGGEKGLYEVRKIRPLACSLAQTLRILDQRLHFCSRLKVSGWDLKKVRGLRNCKKQMDWDRWAQLEPTLPQHLYRGAEVPLCRRRPWLTIRSAPGFDWATRWTPRLRKVEMGNALSCQQGQHVVTKGHNWQLCTKWLWNSDLRRRLRLDFRLFHT